MPPLNQPSGLFFSRALIERPGRFSAWLCDYLVRLLGFLPVTMCEVQFPYIELIYALRGYPGIVFTLKDGQSNEFTIADTILCRQMIHPSELSMASRLLPIATTNLIIRRATSSIATTLCPYRSFLYQGILSALEGYDDQLNSLQERLFDSSKPLPLSDFYCLLIHEEFLSIMSELLKQLNAKKVSINEVITSIYEYPFKNGVSSDTSDSLKIVFKHLLKPLMDDIWSFIIYGHLRGESKGVFFVKENSSGEVKLHATDVPSFIGHRGATKIQFIGKLVRLYNQGSFMFDDCCDELFTLMNSVQEKFHEKSIVAFIERVRVEAATFSSAYVLQEENIMAFFSIIKQMFLTGNEKIWLYFVERASNIVLCNTWSDSRKERTMKQIIEAIMLKFYYTQSQIDDFVKFFTITFNRDDDDPSSLPQLSLSINLPLLSSKIIRPSQLTKYEKLFNYLLQLFLARHQLSSSWMLDMKSHRQRNDTPRSVFALRHKLTLLIEHLYFYLKVNVIETLFNEFTTEFTNCCDYELMQLKHVAFLSNLMRESLIDYPPCEKLLRELLSLASQFTNGMTGINHLDDVSLRLSSICGEMNVLFSTLKNYRSHSGLSNLLFQMGPCLTRPVN